MKIENVEVGMRLKGKKNNPYKITCTASVVEVVDIDGDLDEIAVIVETTPTTDIGWYHDRPFYVETKYFKPIKE